MRFDPEDLFLTLPGRMSNVGSYFMSMKLDLTNNKRSNSGGFQTFHLGGGGVS